jgi:hypothetical protein
MNYTDFAAKKKEKLAKKKFHQEKNSIRVVGKIPEEPKKEKATGESKLFDIIADKRMYEKDGMMWVKAIHRDEKTGKVCEKEIPRAILTPVNFDHRSNKSRGESLRLDEDNIDIVSFAYHFHKHNGQIMRLVYPN